MRIDVRQHPSLHRNPALDDHASKRLWAALDRFEPEVVWVRVVLGAESRRAWCRVQAEVTPNLHLLVVARHERLLDAVDQAADKLAAALARARGRRDSVTRSWWRQGYGWG